MDARREAVIRAAYLATWVALVAWAVHWLWGPEIPPGVDATGHLTRLEVGMDLFRSWRLDGWFDRAMLGYQTHLMYGPGLALAVAALRLATFGQLSVPGAYEVVGVIGYAAVVPATVVLGRALGVPTGGARAAGLLALAVSSGRGGGIEGAFDLGLMPQNLAIPLVLLAWALMVREPARPMALAALVAAVAVTHPQSLVILVLFAPLVIAAAWAAGRFELSRWEPLAWAAVASLGLSAWWWVPAVVNRDLRGVLTSWDLPTFWDHLRLVYHGERGWIGWAAVVVVGGWSVGVALGIMRRDRGILALAALPLVALGLLHGLEWLLADRFHEAVFLPNRGLAYACLLTAPVAGLSLHTVLERWQPTAWVLVALPVALAVGTLRPPEAVFAHPVDGMRTTAALLGEVVAPGHRFAYVESDVDAVGVVAPGRWLGWASGATNIGPFGSEYAPGVGPTLRVFDPPTEDTVDEWVDHFRRLQVTHLVAGDAATAEVLGAAADLRRIAVDEPMTIWAVDGAPPYTIVAAEPERLTIDVPASHAPTMSLALGYHPGWAARVDGEPAATGRDVDGRLTLDLLPGPHRVELEWSEPPGHALGRVATVALLLPLAVSRWLDRRARGRLPA